MGAFLELERSGACAWCSVESLLAPLTTPYVLLLKQHLHRDQKHLSKSNEELCIV